LEVDRYGGSRNEVAEEFGCDSRTVSDAVLFYGAGFVDQ
jgi:hypothetical protein